MNTKTRNHTAKVSLRHTNKQDLKQTDTGIGSVSAMNESTEEYVLYVAVPGMQRKDFSIAIKGKELIISADKKEAMHVFPAKEEQSFLHWEEIFKLPADADTVMTAAVYRNGELAIHIPKGKNTAARSLVDIFVY